MADTLTAALETLKANTKDYPSTLKAVMAVDALAISIYYCRSTYYSLPAIPWDGLSDAQRDLFRTRSRAFLDALGMNARVFSTADLTKELFALGCALNQERAVEVQTQPFPRAVKR